LGYVKTRYFKVIYLREIIVMNTKIIKSDEKSITAENMKEAGDIIRRGGLVAFPTETVYGLGGDALNPEASKRIYAAKGRPSDNPLIVHIYRMEDLYKIAEDISDGAVRLAERFWPGPLTMIFKKKPIVPEQTTGGLDTVAVRMPDNRIALSFIEAAGGFIAAPSANLSGRPSPTTAEHVTEDMNGRIDMIIDGGSSVIGLESTIVDMTGDVPMILRPGYINGEMVKEVLGDVSYDPAVFGEQTEGLRPRAPGMKYRHYAPKGELTIVKGSRAAVTAYIGEEIVRAAGEGKRVGVISAGRSLTSSSEEGHSPYRGCADNDKSTPDRVYTDEACEYQGAAAVMNIGTLDDEDSIARHLYSVLRECDEQDIDIIYSEDFSTPRIGQAIMNRLIKAAGHKIIEV
jgi:L-threonylcarbamoyladenylate synthase